LLTKRQNSGCIWLESIKCKTFSGYSQYILHSDPEDPQKDLYDVDNENTVIVLEDWYHTPAMRLEEQMFSTNNTDLLTP
jgi:iron transport multicopper oxidase